MIPSDLLSQLDNPAWHALTTTQQSFATGKDHVRRYQRNILPFAAYESGANEHINTLDRYLEPGDIFFLIGELPALPSNWTLVKELPCVQMILQQRVNKQEEDISISLLTDRDSADMFNLIDAVQPGYYEPDTHRLGSYYGIRQEDKLVAIAGERMRLEGLSEISAICTDPAYSGRGYARRLITHLCNTNLDKGILPFLHVLETNERAIRLYEFLGFTRRRGISFWQLKKK